MNQTPSEEERPGGQFDAPDGIRNAASDAPQTTPPQAAAPDNLLPDAAQFRFPVLRTRHTFYGSEVVAIYPDHLLTGACFVRHVPFTEEMCHVSGEAELKRHLHRSRSIAFEDVKELHEGKPAKYQSLGFPGESTKFTLRLKKGKDREFLISTPQVWDVRAVLFENMRDRYHTRVSRGGGCVAALVILISFLVFVYSVIIAAAEQKPEALVTAVLSLAVVGGAWYFLQSRNKASSKLASLPAKDAPEQKKRKKRAGARRKAPFYSPALGWTLKIMGVVYWIAIESPLTDSVLKINYQAQSKIWLLLFMPAALMIYVGYQLCQRRYDPQKSDDTRKPILYLRAFDEDAMTSLQPSGTVASIAGVRNSFHDGNLRTFGALDAGRVSVMDMALTAHPTNLLRMFFNVGAGSAEETIVRHLETYGPVIAIGRPGEMLSTPGAARIYLSDDTWQAQITSELQRCQCIVVQPGLSEGVHWELEQIRSQVHPGKVLLCLVSYWQDPQRYEELCRLLDNMFHIQMPRVVPFLDAPAFVYFDAGWVPRVQEVSYRCPALWPLTGEATDLGYTLQPFIQGMHGGEREQPRRSRWPWSLRTAFASVGAIIIGLTIAIVPGGVVHYACETLFTRPSAPSISAVQPVAQPTSTMQPVAQPNQDLRPDGQSNPPAQPVAQAEKITLSGKKAPYHFTVPSTLETLKPENEAVEHSFISPDKLLMIQVLADTQQEDVSAIATQRMEVNQKELQSMNKGEGGSQPTLDSTRTLAHAGVDWIESRISVKNAANGVDALEITRASSSPRGTVIVVALVYGLHQVDAGNLKLAEEILDSFTVE